LETDNVSTLKSLKVIIIYWIYYWSFGNLLYISLMENWKLFQQLSMNICFKQ